MAVRYVQVQYRFPGRTAVSNGIVTVSYAVRRRSSSCFGVVETTSTAQLSPDTYVSHATYYMAR